MYAYVTTRFNCFTLGINPNKPNGLSHAYQMDESTFISRGSGSDFSFLFLFFDKNPVSKQNSPRWEAEFYGVTSGAILFCYVPGSAMIKRTPGLYGLNT